VENRFSDLMVDLTDRDGLPVDTIVWLRNGAGKTTMLSLLLALILPARSDFLATRTKNEHWKTRARRRHCSMSLRSGGSAGAVLLTGAVYEWDVVCVRTSTTARERTDSGAVVVCQPDPSVEGAVLEELPFTRRSRGVYDRERFCAHITGLAAKELMRRSGSNDRRLAHRLA